MDRPETNQVKGQVGMKIDGHEVDPDKVDRFFNGSDGSRVTDEQWDESRDRTAESLDDLRLLGFEYVGDSCPSGDEVAQPEGVIGYGDLVPSDD